MSFRGVGLFEFLVEAELQQYYNNFKNDLKVQNISQLKWVTEEDLDSIGLSKPEIRRLKKYSNKFCAQNYLSKVRNKLMGRRETSSPAVPPLATSLYVSQPPHIVKSPPKHIIPSDAIVVNKELGTGEFGVVQQGVWTNDDGHRIQVAIKCLSKERMQSNPTEFLKEATIMHNIEHEHIVRLYGVVLENNTLMLVTELAPLRSLLECLKEPNLRPSFPVLTMCGFAVQICDGMHYLESKRLIHRDLAARNILVFSKNTVKISDFGLSRMLGVGKDYYQTNFNVNLKLPIAWCAPECINYLRFTSASDVWAFGVTLWEMFSYGFQPWAALTGQQILEAIDEPSFQRLEQPDACPKEYYRLMLQCWQHVPAQRPDFYQLTQLLPECKPEQVQAVEMASAPPSAAAPLKRERTLAYVIGEIVTVLDKRPLEDHPNMWKGVTNSGKTGLFNPSHFVAYIGSNLPRNSEARGSFGRGDAKTAYSSKRRLKPEMISAPQNDLKHTVHVGMDGTLFGDVSFLGDKYQQLPSRHGSLRQDRQDEAAAPMVMARADAEISDRAPLLSAGTAATAAGGAPEPLQRTAGKLAAAGGAKHEYHEINSESGAPAAAAGAQSLVDLQQSQPPSQVCSEPDPFDLGPSLMDEVMSVLAPSCLSAAQPKPRDRIMSDESASGGEISNMCNEIREQGARYLREQSERKGKEPRMRDISESDRRTLEHAIAMANDLAARSMAALDAEPLDTPCTPSSPSKKKFTFKLKPSPPLSRRNFSSEAASIQDVQASLREKEREAYDILVQRTPQVQSALPIAAVQPTCHSFQDADESPLRLLRDRGGKQRKAIINAATIDRSQGVDRSRRKAVNGTSGTGRDTPPQLSPTKNGTGLQSWQRTMSIDRHLDAAPVSFDEPDDGGPNALPLPPRDRNKSSQDTSSKMRHQRKHPLVIPSSIPTTLPETELPSSFTAPVSLNAGCASRSDMSASSSSLFTASSLPRGSPPAKPPRLNLSSSLGEPPLPAAPLSASTADGASSWCSTGDLLYTWRDHVSCEDLLEFAADRPNWRRTRGPAHGAHSDEVRIMLKVLGATADREACVAALDRTGWDVHKAIKLRQAVSAVDSRVPATEVAGALQQLDWDVNKAVDALTARHAAVGEPTVV